MQQRLNKPGSNRPIAENTRGSLSKLAEATSVEITLAVPLAIDGWLYDLMRALADDIAAMEVDQRDHINYELNDCFAKYRQLVRIFPQLKAYRKAQSRDRFQPPDTRVEEALEAIIHFFADQQESGNVLSYSLSLEMKDLMDKLTELKRAMSAQSGGKRKPINPSIDDEIVVHRQIATSVGAVWSWIISPERKLERLRLPREEQKHLVSAYKLVEQRLATHMEFYQNYWLYWY